MHRLYKLVALVLVVGLLGGCYPVYLDPLPEQNPFATADARLWSFISYVEGHWVYETDLPGELCQAPAVSYQRMRGDCDDFAVMVAYYIQQAYQYDTFIIFTSASTGGKHAVAFLQASKAFEEQMTSYCGNYPYWTVGTLCYVPLDMPQNGGTCPLWAWLHTGPNNTTRYEWSDLVGQAI